MVFSPDLLKSYLDVIITALGTVAGIYLSFKATGRIVYPAEKIEAGKAKIKSLAESNAALGNVAELVGNISIDELNSIFAKNKELEGSKMTTEQKALVLGTMFLEAMKSPAQ